MTTTHTAIRLPQKARTFDDLYDGVYPESWYLVMPSRALRRGKMLPFEAFDRKWVVARTESGAVQVFSRFCPHMGAPLHTGSVKGERVVCPFHRWEFEAGMCARIPYLEGGKIPPTARLTTLPTREHLGYIWAYHGESPSHEIPDLPEARDPRFGRCERAIPYEVHMLSVLENGCDVQHFKYIHGVDFVSYDLEMTHDERHAFGFHLRKHLRPVFGVAPPTLTTTIRYVGASMIFGADYIGDYLFARFIAAPLPVSRRQIRYNLIVFPRRVPFAPPGLGYLAEKIMGRLFFHGAEQDYGPIWSQMDTSAGGVMVAEDAHQIRFRRYYKRHLASHAHEQPDHALES